MNKQPPEKVRFRPEGKLEVHSIFPTIQGEGPFVGTPCVFIRLAGCNLQCPGCDTEYTNYRTITTPEAILASVNAKAPKDIKLVVITGGEPFRQDLGPLLAALLADRFYVQIETNGTLPPSEYPGVTYNRIPEMRLGVTVVCSPKTGKIHPKLIPVLGALKYVLSSGQVCTNDGLPLAALDHPTGPGGLARPPKDFKGLVYVQPRDNHSQEENSRNLQAAIQSSMKYGHLLCIQAHKIIGVE